MTFSSPFSFSSLVCVVELQSHIQTDQSQARKIGGRTNVKNGSFHVFCLRGIFLFIHYWPIRTVICVTSLRRTCFQHIDTWTWRHSKDNFQNDSPLDNPTRAPSWTGTFLEWKMTNKTTKKTNIPDDPKNGNFCQQLLRHCRHRIVIFLIQKRHRVELFFRHYDNRKRWEEKMEPGKFLKQRLVCLSRQLHRASCSLSFRCTRYMRWFRSTNKKMIHQTNLQVDSRTSRLQMLCHIMSHANFWNLRFFVHSCSFSGKETLTSSLGPITPILLWPILMFSIFWIWLYYLIQSTHNTICTFCVSTNHGSETQTRRWWCTITLSS